MKLLKTNSCDGTWYFCISDISATAFYKAQPIIDFVVEYLNVRDTSKRLSDQERIKVWTIIPL